MALKSIVEWHHFWLDGQNMKDVTLEQIKSFEKQYVE